MTNLPVRFDLRDLLWRWVFQLRHFSLPATAQHDVRTTTGHVGGDSDRSRVARLCDNRRFVGVEFGVQNVML
ncbi:Uncharacterised protein [Citrobacter koseri]|uniref:Uncharacterized protein n=1 Tax=Citrobacter koseri TaxID=545 RepID=A0A2X2VRS1_CITKO|nr:Uncharacterised protein [Citrobacter koseri]